MNPEDARRRLAALAQRLSAGSNLTRAEKRTLAKVFNRIAEGEDANHVLGLKPRPGQRVANLVARQRMSLILHWVSGLVQPDPKTQKRTLSVEKACEMAVLAIVPVAKQVFPGADKSNYEAEYILRCWNEPAYAHMRSPYRQPDDLDHPY